MTTLQISKEKAKELYPTASTEFKTMLEETFGKDFFRVSIMDRIKSFEDAYFLSHIYNYTAYPRYVTKQENAFFKLKIITKVLNEGKEGSYFPAFNKDFQFHCSSLVTLIYIPRKLLLATKELSDYAGTQFIELYNDYIL